MDTVWGYTLILPFWVGWILLCLHADSTHFRAQASPRDSASFVVLTVDALRHERLFFCFTLALTASQSSA